MANPARPSLNALRYALVAAIVAGIAYGAWSGTFAEYADRAALKARFASMGPRGMLAFVAAYTLLQPLGVPGSVFALTAPLLWPWHVAYALTMAGTMGASVVGYSTARFVARDSVASRLPARWRRYDEALAQNAFRTVFGLRFVFWTAQALHAWFGVSNVGFWTHFWGTLAGCALPLLAVSLYGESFVDELLAHPARTVGVTLALGAAGWALYAWRGRHGER
jgi:uncharacterized membrane protein YdjX (TVP38/TMEM64 family)